MIAIQKNSHTLVIRFEGIESLDARVSTRLKADLEQVLDGASYKIAVDLSNIEFIDSSGFGALISLLKKVRTTGGQLFLCKLNSEVKDLMSILQLEQVFLVKDSVEDAIA